MDNNGTMGDFFFEGFSSFNISEELIFVCISKIPVNFMELTRFLKVDSRNIFWEFSSIGRGDTWIPGHAKNLAKPLRFPRKPGNPKF